MLSSEEHQEKGVPMLHCGHSWFLNSFDPQFDAQIYNHSHERILYCFHHESDIHSGIVLISVFPVNMYFFPFLFSSHILQYYILTTVSPPSTPA